MWAVVVAGGSGSRFGGPKQFAQLEGRTVLEWALDGPRSLCDGVVLVLPGDRSANRSELGVDAVAVGGPTRAASVRSGLACVPEDARVVVVHDAARPLASTALFLAVVAPLLEEPPAADGVVCAVPLSDTVKRVAPDRKTVVRTLAREELVAVQTPQAFLARTLRAAHEHGGDASDDAALVEAAGGIVHVVPGERRNVKITDPSDLDFVRQMLTDHRGAAGDTREGDRQRSTS